jgi:NAD(P)-dependent dehydrogenase (short-subunit alcohol dehydrogenase family)
MTTPMETRVALVSGANKGIGRAIAHGLIDQGHLVYVGARDSARGAEAAEALGPMARSIRLDVTDPASITAAVTQVSRDVGRLDALINNAGVNVGGRRALDHLPRPTEETVDDIRFVYETNVFAVVAMIDAFLPLVRRSDRGRIVNITSRRGSIGDPGAWVGQPSMAYSSSKTALNAITAHFARELAPEGILVNGAAPGHVATDFNGFRGTRTPSEGAAVAIRLATLNADGPTGEVYEDETRLPW